MLRNPGRFPGARRRCTVSAMAAPTITRVALRAPTSPGDPLARPWTRVLMVVDPRGRYLALPYQADGGDGSRRPSARSVLLATVNPLVARWLAAGGPPQHPPQPPPQHPGIPDPASSSSAVLEVPLTVAKHLAHVMRLELVVVVGVACDRDTGELEWDIALHRPPRTSVRAARLALCAGGQPE